MGDAPESRSRRPHARRRLHRRRLTLRRAGPAGAPGQPVGAAAAAAGSARGEAVRDPGEAARGGAPAPPADRRRPVAQGVRPVPRAARPQQDVPPQGGRHRSSRPTPTGSTTSCAPAASSWPTRAPRSFASRVAVVEKLVAEHPGQAARLHRRGVHRDRSGEDRAGRPPRRSCASAGAGGSSSRCSSGSRSMDERAAGARRAARTRARTRRKPKPRATDEDDDAGVAAAHRRADPAHRRGARGQGAHRSGQALRRPLRPPADRPGRSTPPPTWSTRSPPRSIRTPTTCRPPTRPTSTSR